MLKMLAVLLLAVVAAGAAFVYFGAYNVAGDDPHWDVTYKLFETLRERSVAARVDAVPVPADLANPERVRRGAGDYDVMCAGCHLRPGMADSELRKGLYPQPPNFAAGDRQDPDSGAARQFWVIKHGLKMTGMPAWQKAGVDDDAIWDLVALLQALPSLTPDDYAAQVAASPGHTHSDHSGHDHSR